MTHKVYHVTDLGPGDGGKGGVVHAISHMMRAHTILKVGGAQGSHGVRTSKGEKCNFSQWGCGTFEGVKTHLTARMVVAPVRLLDEEAVLRYDCGITNAFDLLTIDREALCATPYHRIASRLQELARGDQPRGTIGSGVGEAYRDLHRYPDLAIRAGDIGQPDIKDRLAAVREQIRHNLAALAEIEFLPDDHVLAAEQWGLLANDHFLEQNAEEFLEVARRAQIVDRTYLMEHILAQDGVAVIESSHGVLTDQIMGFHPHTSALRTLPEFTHQMLNEAGYNGQIVNIGVTRAYAIRHGAGPLPTADPSMAERLLPGSNKAENRYQGKVRVGPLDLVLLRYALAACGGPDKFDGLAISWFDQIQTNGVWPVCHRYLNATDRGFFTPEGELRVQRRPGVGQRDYQAELTWHLQRCQPVIETVNVPSGADRDTLYSLCADVISAGTKVPVRMVSFGPTELDKLCR